MVLDEYNNRDIYGSYKIVVIKIHHMTTPFKCYLVNYGSNKQIIFLGVRISVNT